MYIRRFRTKNKKISWYRHLYVLQETQKKEGISYKTTREMVQNNNGKITTIKPMSQGGQNQDF